MPNGLLPLMPFNLYSQPPWPHGAAQSKLLDTLLGDHIMMEAVSMVSETQKARRYAAPPLVMEKRLADLIGGVRSIPEKQQKRFGFTEDENRGMRLFCAGDVSLLQHPCVAIVGSRKVSKEGAARARRLARELVKAGYRCSLWLGCWRRYGSNDLRNTRRGENHWRHWHTN